jgi:hypothetical protein
MFFIGGVLACECSNRNAAECKTARLSANAYRPGFSSRRAFYFVSSFPELFQMKFSLDHLPGPFISFAFMFLALILAAATVQAQHPLGADDNISLRGGEAHIGGPSDKSSRQILMPAQPAQAHFGDESETEAVKSAGGKNAEPMNVIELLRSVKIDDFEPAKIDLEPERFALPDRKANSAKDDPDGTDDTKDEPPPISKKFHWRPAIEQTLMMLGIQHGYAVGIQEKTRRALANGNFFGDYWRSIRKIEGWDDGNRFATNYIAHPMQGGLTGFIFVQNHDRARMQTFNDSKEYWNDRLKALIWSTAWSTQFELGPISQSSIGNVGMYGGMGYVDLVVTPTAGTAWLISEEAIDRYVIRHVETRSLFIKAMVRMFLNPMRTVANLLRFREPWYRDRPFGH